MEAKRSKTDRVLTSLVATEDKAQFQEDCDWVVEQLNLYPSKMKAVKAVLRLKEDGDFNKELFWDPKWKTRSIQNIPPNDLKPWFTKTGEITTEELKALLGKDMRSLHKMLMRLCVLPQDCPIGITEKAEFFKMCDARLTELGNFVKCIQWDRSFQISWESCGLYKLLPPFVQTDGADPSSHEYQSMECCGRKADLKLSGVQVKASWRLLKNWDLLDACLVNPQFPDCSLPCFRFFTGELCNSLSLGNIPALVAT
eukprot:6270175-Amphidinium_carterae.1